MNSTATSQFESDYTREDLEPYYDKDVLDNQPRLGTVEPLYGDFINEIEIWARRALAGNGFGDF